MEAPLTPTSLAAAIGISVPYASQLLSGRRPIEQAMALRIWRAAGAKLGGLSALSDAECAELERLAGAVAATKPIVMSGEGFAS